MTHRLLRAMQPESGGYLEATPLTSFVVMSLAAMGQTGSPVVEDGRAVPRRVDARRWQLADRHQPGDVGDDAVDWGARRTPAALAPGDIAVDAAVAARSAEHAGASVHPRGAGSVGVDAVERRRARRGRHVRGARWRCGDSAIRIRRRWPPLPPACAGCWGSRTGTAASRRSAAAGGRCPFDRSTPEITASRAAGVERLASALRCGAAAGRARGVPRGR